MFRTFTRHDLPGTQCPRSAPHEAGRPSPTASARDLDEALAGDGRKGSALRRAGIGMGGQRRPPHRGPGQHHRRVHRPARLHRVQRLPTLVLRVGDPGYPRPNQPGIWTISPHCAGPSILRRSSAPILCGRCPFSARASSSAPMEPSGSWHTRTSCGPSCSSFTRHPSPTPRNGGVIIAVENRLRQPWSAHARSERGWPATIGSEHLRIMWDTGNNVYSTERQYPEGYEAIRDLPGPYPSQRRPRRSGQRQHRVLSTRGRRSRRPARPVRRCAYALMDSTESSRSRTSTAQRE